MDNRIGQLFPVGGPVPPGLVIGRVGDIDEIERRLRESLHTMLVGPRRIGKTTVCDAACERMRSSGALVVEVEVPERTDAATMLQLIIDRCSRMSPMSGARRVFRAARPFIAQTLEDQGIPLDLSELGVEPSALPTRAVLSLPRLLAEQLNRPVVLFLDELQRVVTYVDGEQILSDLVDLYGGTTDVVVLVDGSDERVLTGMLGAPVHFGKLCDRLTLAPTIPRATWTDPLFERFQQAGMELDEEALDLLLAYGAGRPYETMTAARYAALSVRKLAGDDRVSAFEAQMGIDEAIRHLADDGA